MPDYSCIRVANISTMKNHSPNRITDNSGRDWYYIELQSATEEINGSLTSEYAAASWLMDRMNSVLTSIGAPRGNIWDGLSDNISNLVSNFIEIQQISFKRLPAVLSNIESNVAKTPFIVQNIVDQYKIDQHKVDEITTPSRSEIIANQISTVLKEHLDFGSKKYRSGELNLCGYNYAKDILSAVEYAGTLILDSQLTTIESIIKMLKQNTDQFEHIYGDREGFGCGTIVGIISDLENLSFED